MPRGFALSRRLVQDGIHVVASVDRKIFGVQAFDQVASVIQSAVAPAGMGLTSLGAALIAEEFSRTEHSILAITGQKALLEREPVLAKSVQLRNPYVDPLNYIQVEMISRLRGLAERPCPKPTPSAP